jgi:DNA-directed RNA polymerase subunit beta'
VAGTPAETWKSLQDRVQDAVKTYFPFEGRTRQLVLHGVSFDESGAVRDDIRSQEVAKEQKKTWGAQVYGDVSLVDKVTGKELDRTKIKLLTLPKPTNRYSYIVDGSEWQVDNLWRLRSGVYAHIKQNGEMETEFNLAKPFAGNPRIKIPFDPESRKFKFKLGTYKPSLYSVLKVLGVQDEDMKKAWGEDIYKSNVTKDPHKEIEELYGKINKNTRPVAGALPLTYDQKASAVVAEFQKTGLLPEMTKLVFGKPFDSVNGEALLLGSKRILGVTRGDIAPDDRNSLIFKTLHGTDDFLHERLVKPKMRRTLSSKINNNIDRQTKVRDVISGDLFNRPIKEFFTSSMLSKNPEQVNPLEMLSNHRSTTIMAEEGGIKNEQSVTPDMKLINPSHFGFLDPIHTPESERTGITLHLPIGVKKQGNDPIMTVYDLKTHELTKVTPMQLHAENVLLPDQVTWKDTKPHPIAELVKMKDPVTHEMLAKPFSTARYLVIQPHQLFDEATNLIPFLQNNQGNRTMTASRQGTQAVSLYHREQPLVQVQAGGSRTWEKLSGFDWSHPSQHDGKVVEIKTSKENGHAEAIITQTADGKNHETQIYNHFPLNDSKTFIHSSPLVKVGDQVKKGQTLADTNFTRQGSLSLGTNLRVAYLPYKGYNFEDGIVISDSASKKLTSEHLHRMTLEADPDKDEMSKSKFIAYAGTMAKRLTKEQMAKVGANGLIQVGQKVEPGDVLIAAVGKKEYSGETSRMMSRLSKKAFNLQDRSVVWESDHPGEVVKVVQAANGKGATVYVKTLESAEVGDKIVGRHGNKAIITRILPDHEMPRIGSADGEHVQVLMNPSGVPTRINLGQMLETAASKIAKKTGVPYVVNNFAGPDVDYHQKVTGDLLKNGLSDQEELYDPTNNKRLGSVLTGNQYIFKLKHQVEKKLAVRGGGASQRGTFTVDHAPKGTGAEHPGQGIGQLEFYALLAHGARANLREMATYKSDQHLGDNLDPMSHTDFWDRVRTGQPLPAPKPTFAYKKFENLLTGLGVNIEKRGNELHLMPLTDAGVLKLSHGEIKDGGRVLRGKDAKELEKGLFDPKVTGGLPDDKGKGLFWSHIHLAEPVPNPVFVGASKTQIGPAVLLSGLKYDDFEAVAKGKKMINGETGGLAINNILKKIDVKSELKKIREELPKLKKDELNKANRRAKFLIALDKLGMKPNEAYMMNYLPVLPPAFRPIVPMPDGSLRFDDINQYYRSIALLNERLKNPIKELGGRAERDVREQLYDAMRAYAGLGGTPVYESNREMKGILDIVAGDQPKQGYFQKRLMKRRQELSMRSTIIPEPAMHLDYVGLPKDAAMELYKPFVVRELGLVGLNPMTALRSIKENKDIAWKALDKAMDKRPVLLKRDPALHKFSIMAFKPKVVEGKAIQIHPLVTAGYNADFDGDTMSAFVPLTDEAVRESHKMFPSNNLFSATTGGIMYEPTQESLLGLHLLTKWGKKSGKSFPTFAEAQKAKEKGVIEMDDVIKVANKETTLGRMTINSYLPHEFRDTPDLLHDPKYLLRKSNVRALLGDIAKKDPQSFALTVDRLKDLGNDYSYSSGFSFGLKDLDVQKGLRAEILNKADHEAAGVKKEKGSQADKDAKTIEIYDKATKEMVVRMKPHMEKTDNKIFAMIDSGARGNDTQFRQIAMAPMLMKDGAGRTLLNPVKKSYTEGLDVGDYWTTLHGARMGTLQKVEGTSEPGSLTKEIANVMMPSMIVSHDCGTSAGIHMDVTDPEIQDRVLARPLKLGNHTLPAGEVVTPEITAAAMRHKQDKLVVRSPLKCAHGQGICAKCYGLNENGRFHETGTNIGVIAGSAMGEPATQLAMDSFHTGGVAASRGAGAVDKFTRLDQLLGMPKILPHAATIAAVEGPIQSIEKDKATNGHFIHIGGQKHYTPAGHEILVKPGQVVSRGERLTNGPINPHELLPLTDIHHVQNYLTDELYSKIYKSENVKRRNIETVVRSLTNLSRVADPGDSDHLHGDMVLRTVVDEHNRGLKHGEHPIVADPIIRSANQIALDQHEDWMARLNFQRIKQTVLEGAARGWKSDLHGSNPVPGYAFGAEFGRGTKEKPHNY